MQDQGYSPASGAFSEQEGRLHDEAFARLREALAAGLGFEEACAKLVVDDPELRRLIIDDFLKVTVAERHFRDGQGTDAVAAVLKIPVERVNRAREEMIDEVSRAAAEVFKQQAGGAPAGDAN